MTPPCRLATLGSSAALFLALWTVIATVPAHAQTSWLQSLPPEQVLRLRPDNVSEVLRAQSHAAAAAALAGPRAKARPGASASAPPAGTEWLRHGPRQRVGHALVVDTRRGHVLMVGGWSDRDLELAVWSYDPVLGEWSKLAPWVDAAGLSAARTSCGAVYDSLRDRLLVATSDGTLELDALALTGTPAWSHVWTAPAGVSSAAAMTIDTRRDQLALLVGAYATPSIIRVTLAGLVTWTIQAAAGPTDLAPTAPSSVTTASAASGSMVYDARRDSFFVLAGMTLYRINAAGAPASVTSSLPYPSPCGTMTTLARDARNDRLLIIDDRRAAFSFSLADGSFLRLDNNSCGSPWPGSAVAFDPRTRRIFYDAAICTYVVSPGPVLANLARAFVSLDVDSGFTLPTHTPVPQAAVWRPEGPPDFGAHMGHWSGVDPAIGRLVVVGSAGGGQVYPATDGLVVARPLDTDEQWRPLGTNPSPAPTNLFMESVTYDPIHHALLLYGGQASDGTGRSDLWSLPLAAGGAWTKLTPSGSAPPPLRGSAFFYDAAHVRFVLLGGDDITSTIFAAWELKLDPTPTWRPLAVTGALGLPYAQVFADDARGDAWSTSYRGPLNHVTLGADEIHGDVIPATGEPALGWLALGFDPVRRRLVTSTRNVYGTVFELGELSTVTLGATADFAPLAVTGSVPKHRYLFSSLYDPSLSRLWLTGGYDDNDTYFDDVLTMQFAPELATPVLASLVSAVADARGAHLVWNVPARTGIALAVERSGDGTAWSGAGPVADAGADAVAFDDATLIAGTRAAYRLRATSAAGTQVLGDAVWLEAPVSSATLALSPLANPARGPLGVRLSLAANRPAHLRLLDVGGRLVGEANVPAGTTAWTFAAPRAPGLYFAELVQGGERRVTRLVAAP